MRIQPVADEWEAQSDSTHVEPFPFTEPGVAGDTRIVDWLHVSFDAAAGSAPKLTITNSGSGLKLLETYFEPGMGPFSFHLERAPLIVLPSGSGLTYTFTIAGAEPEVSRRIR